MIHQGLADSRRAFRRLVAGAALVLVSVGIFLGFSLHASHARYQAGAVDNLLNLTLNLERYLYARLQSTDLVLQAAAHEYELLSARSPVTEPQFTAVLARLQKRLPEAPPLRAADAEGWIVYGSDVDASRRLNIGKRRYFNESRATPDLVIGLPHKSMIGDRWVLTIARQLRDSRGEFRGVVYLNFDLQDFIGILGSLKIGDHGVVTLFNAHRDVLARVPELPPTEDEAPPRLSAPATLKALAEGQTTALFDTHSSIDQVFRTLMYRKVDPFPVYILAGLAHEDFLAPWYHELLISGVFWLALASVAVLLLYMQRRSEKSLSAAIGELLESRKLANAASESKSAFLANMSHEIRTPLNGVLGFAQIGLRDPAMPAAARQKFASILASGNLLQGILNDVLDMSKIEAGKLLLDEVPTLLRPVAQQAVDLVHETAREKGIAMRTTVDEQVPEVAVVDPLRLGQVLLNLLSNAVKFTDRGHVELKIGVDGDVLVFEVADSGRGMTDEEVARIFTAFEQADRSTTRRFGGTGLGLTITRRLVELMKGTVAVSTRLGEGSVFTVRLPLKRPVAEAAVTRHESWPAGSTLGLSAVPGESVPSAGSGEVARRRRLQGLSVLVAEDNVVNQMVIQSLLELEGARVDIVSDGLQAIERIADRADAGYDVVLLDVMMPGIDGYETARRLRELDPALPLIGQTAHALPEDRVRCLQAGMVDRLSKPIHLEELVATVLKHARRRQV